jgi:hypothetical protein
MSGMNDEWAWNRETVSIIKAEWLWSVRNINDNIDIPLVSLLVWVDESVIQKVV